MAAGAVGEIARELAVLQVHPLLATGALAGPASSVTLGLAQVSLAQAAIASGAQSLCLHELGWRTLVVVQARRVAEEAVEAAIEVHARVVAVVLLSSLPELAVVGVLLQVNGLPVTEGIRAFGFTAPGAVEFLARGLDPLVPGLVQRAQAFGGGAFLTERGSLAVMAHPPRAGRPPAGLGVLVGSGVDLGVGDDATVRVTQVHRDGGTAWIVQVPGTQSWPPRGGPNPHDLTSDVLLLTQQDAALAAGVERALEAAQEEAGPGADGPVMLVGHSQGGMVAAALAASPTFRSRHQVTHVVTYGSPISRVPVPADVEVLALQHRQDAVPRLDGAPDPRRRGWVTVTRDVGDDPGVGRDLVKAHAIEEYAETAADAERSSAAAMEDWRRGAGDFLPADGAPESADDRAVVRDYTLRRVPVPEPGAAGSSPGGGGPR